MNRGVASLRAVMVTLGSSWIGLLVSIARVLLVPVKLGANGMGEVTLAGSFLAIALMLTGLGTSTFLVRAVARDRSLLDQYISNALWLRMLMSLVVLAALLGLTQLLGYSAQTEAVILIFGLAMVINTISNVFESGLQALEQMSWRSIAMAAGNISSTLLGIGLLFLGADVVVYALCVPFGALLQFAL